MNQEVRTTIGRTYAVLVTQAPCTLYYQDDEASEKLTVLTAEEPGTYAFVAFGILLKKETGSCRVVESFNYAPLGSPAKGGAKEFYVTIDADGTRRTHNNSKLINGNKLLFFGLNSDWNNIILDADDFDLLATAENGFSDYRGSEWTKKLPVLENGRHAFESSSLTSFKVPLPRLKDGKGMFQWGPYLDKPSVLLILNSLQLLATNPIITIYMAKECKGDADVSTALTSAQGRGWTMEITYKS